MTPCKNISRPGAGDTTGGGDPDRAFNRRQPGGWGYNILPFIEETTLHDLGKSGDPKTYTAAKKTASKQRAVTPISLYYCPTRGRGPLVANNAGGMINVDLSGLTELAKTDYAACGGSISPSLIADLPDGGGEGNLAKSNSQIDTQLAKAAATDGVCNTGSEIKASLIKDGLSKTYLVGEKYLALQRGSETTFGDDNQTWDTAYDWDTYRWTSGAPYFDQIVDSAVNSTQFGSSHLGGFGMACCDGTVRMIPYEIDNTIHRLLGGRKDGGPDVSQVPGW
ncbi:MAG: DUF1559 domain-containing protein [Pirellulales bacterium]